jgi:hypothetical protein
LPVAPASQRVDAVEPVFSNQLNVTNPLFPVSSQESVLMLGSEGGEPFRTEVTLLPATKTITCNGQPLQLLVSQYVAFSGGRLTEVALDLYGQDDAGNVWYFGEDVADYEDGVVSSTEGTWLAGREGPAAMIMVAKPNVGDTFRPENAFPVVFEEVTVKEINKTVAGPRGPITGAILTDELHSDGGHENKVFAPGYGEFATGNVGGDLEALALMVPIDRLSGAPPAQLATLIDGAQSIFDGALAGEWSKASDRVDEIAAAWAAYRPVGVPPMVNAEMSDALDALDEAVASQDEDESRQAAIEVIRATLDVTLRYRPAVEIDFARFELLARQIRLDVETEDAAAGVLSDVTTMEWTLDRFSHGLTASSASAIDSLVNSLRAAADAEDLDAAGSVAQQLLDTLAETALPVGVAPPAPAASPAPAQPATRPGRVTAPDTGDGGADAVSNNGIWLVALAGGAATLAAGTALHLRARRSGR